MATAIAPATTDIVAPTATLGDLHAVMAELTSAYPEAGHRVAHGAFLAVMGHAESDAALGWWVRSERDAETRYFVLPEYGTCTCVDHQRHGHLSPCKHRLGVEVLRRLERAEAEREQPAECCIDCEDGGRESPEGMRRRCSNCPLTETWTDEDRDRGYQDVETLLDVAGAPIPFRLTPQALAALDEARQRDAARCPTCDDYKQHGSLYCAGDGCERPRPALRLVAVDGAARQ